jgi:death on curing protein
MSTTCSNSMPSTSDHAGAAAALLRSIAQNQPFLDGNKRIAWIATRTFLAANGFDIRADTDEGVKLMIDLAERNLDVDDVAEFLAKHAAARDEKRP